MIRAGRSAGMNTVNLCDALSDLRRFLFPDFLLKEESCKNKKLADDPDRYCVGTVSGSYNLLRSGSIASSLLLASSGETEL